MKKMIYILLCLMFLLISTDAVDTAKADSSMEGQLFSSEATSSAMIGQVYEEEEPLSYQIPMGNVISGTVDDLVFHDQKRLRVASQAGNAGTSLVKIELQYHSDIPVSYWNETLLRICTTASKNGISMSVAGYNWTSGIFEDFASQQAISNFCQLIISQQMQMYITNQGWIRIQLTFMGAQSFDILIDQAQLVYGYEISDTAVQIQSYKVSSGVLEKGTIVDSTSFAALSERDGTSLKVSSSGNKVAWHTIVPLYKSIEEIHTLRIDYAGSMSADTNPIWLSLYRFDTENWEVIGLLPGTTELARRAFFLSGTKLQNYISVDGDIRIRLYNSATNSFIRLTDYLAVTIYCNVQFSQECCSPLSFVTEYGNSTGSVLALERVDGNALTTQCDTNRKAAVQITFQSSVQLDTIREMSFVLRLRAAQNINAQYISLLNCETGKFSVIKTLSGSDSYETIYVTLDSLRDIEKYFDGDGCVVLRIYNSSSTEFAREIELAQMMITYGGFSRFTIAQISDIHELIGTENFRSIISEVNQVVNPEFSIITGDLSDHGTPEQYALYMQDKQLFQNPVYTTPGNHDVRWWNANGKKTFTDSVGPLYQSFDYGGVHFVLLDSTVNFELDGKINKAQLDWLKQDMASVPSDTPVIWFAHHPFKINNNVTARHELLETAKGHNVIAYMSGHVHYYGNIVEDGIPVNYITYVKDNSSQEFVSIEFTANYYYIYKHKVSDHSKILWLIGRMNNTRQMNFSITQVQQPGPSLVQVTASVVNAPNEVVSMRARIDNYGPYTQLTKNSNGTWSGVIDTSAYTPVLVPGIHFVGVESFDNFGEKWTEYVDYCTTSTKAQLLWTFQTGDMLQATATINNNSVYVGSNDGNLYCIDIQTGVEQWHYETQGTVISKPAVDGTHIIFGSGDTKLYCLNGQTGEKLWEYAAGGSLLSDPLVENGRVYIGCGDGKIYCVNMQNGLPEWQYQTNGLMRQRPIIENGVLYAFVRDTYIWYGLNAQTGELYWRGNAGTDESLFVCGDVRPIVAGGKLWCIDAQNMHSGYINLQTGVLEWEGSLNMVSSRGMATDGTLVFYSSNNGRQITAYFANSAQIAWQKDLRHNSGDSDLQQMQIDSGLVYEGGVLFHLAERGRVTAINPQTGDILWIYDAVGYPERVFWATPEVSGDILLGSGIDGKLYAVSFTN